MKRIYRLTYDSGAGITVWEKTMDELLVPNGTESLLDWMLRETDARGSQVFTLEYAGEQADDTCGACWRCVPNYPYMRLCPTCGNKRCPHANDHDNECTGSNDTGQPGSAYEHGSGEASARRMAAIFGEAHPMTRIFRGEDPDGHE